MYIHDSGDCHMNMKETEVTGSFHKDSWEYMARIPKVNLHSNVRTEPMKECEELHPELTEEYRRIMWEQYELFCKKSLSYGIDNITHGMDVTKNEGVRYSLNGLFWRLSDKINRLRGLLVFNNKEHLKDETVIDTFQDMANYSIIAQIVNNKKWK